MTTPPEIPEAIVEKAARAKWDHDRAKFRDVWADCGQDKAWDQLGDDEREAKMASARAAEIEKV